MDPIKGHVLLVDDEDALRRAFLRTLERAGYSVDACEDGESALARLGERPFDAILSDISMPRMGGIELLKRVREHDLDVPVILMTGAATVATAIQAVEYGALRYLVKPIENAALIKAVGDAVGLAKMARAKREAALLAGDPRNLHGDRAALEASFARALGAIWMAYQPIVSWSRREISAYEALVRSEEPALPHPGALFDAAERLDGLRDLGRTIRRAVAETVGARPAHRIFVNLHTRDLTDGDLFEPDSVLSRIAPHVVLEITERAPLDEVRDAPAKIAALRELGFRIAIDDLGAGYAGLSSFAQLQPDVVKLDMSLVRGIDRDSTKQRLVRSMLSVCADLGMEAVVEGVETVAERDMLLSLGADLLQGFLLAKPSRPFPGVAW